MTDLRKLCTNLGFEEVKTYLASGNISFVTDTPAKNLPTKIERALEDFFGFPVDVIIRSLAQLQKIERSEPFKDIPVTKDTRLYITFLGSTAKGELSLPYIAPDTSFRVLATNGNDIVSVLDLTKATTPDAMSILEKTYGKQITTRNWNTIQKIIDSLV